MRMAFFFAFAGLLTAGNARAEQASQPEGFACFENLSTPEFPRAAMQSRVDGSVWATVHLDTQAKVEKVETEVVSAWSDAAKMLTPAVEKAIRGAKAKPACANKAVTIVFRYQLFGEPTASPKVTSRTDPPNLMWIESQPVLLDKAGV